MEEKMRKGPVKDELLKKQEGDKFTAITEENLRRLEEETGSSHSGAWNLTLSTMAMTGGYNPRFTNPLSSSITPSNYPNVSSNYVHTMPMVPENPVLSPYVPSNYYEHF